MNLQLITNSCAFPHFYTSFIFNFILISGILFACGSRVLCSISWAGWTFTQSRKVKTYKPTYTYLEKFFTAFCSFFHVASLFSTGVDNKKVGVDNEKALELTNSTVFHRGRQWKSSRAGQQNIFFIFQPDFNVEISPKNATKHPVA